MDLVNRYVGAVKEFLPKGQQEDIGRELAENLRAEMDDRAEELGRPLTEAEQAALLKQKGHPILIAGQYQTARGSLSFGPQIIGPVLFPLYARILGLAFSLMAAAMLVSMLLTGAGLLDSLGGIVTNALIQFAIITTIFALGQRHLNRHPEAWDPRDPLQPIPAPANPNWVPRLESVLQIGLVTIGLVWLNSLRGFTLPPELGQIHASVWATAYWGLFAVTALSLVPPIVNLFEPRWVMFRDVTRLAVDAVWLGLLIYLLASGPWVTSGIADRINPIIDIVLKTMIVVMAVVAVLDARPVLGRQRRGAEAA